MSRDLVIDRSIWLRGERNGDVYLLRPADGKMCCLGIYLQACGASPDTLRGRRYPSSVAVALPDEARWLLRPGKPVVGVQSDSLETTELAVTNDDNTITDAEREKRIATLLAKHDVRVTFTDGTAPRASAESHK